MFDLLYLGASRLHHITYDTEFAGSRGLSMGWDSIGGQKLAEAASPADVSLMVQLMMCRQARTHSRKLPTGAPLSQKLQQIYSLERMLCY